LHRHNLAINFHEQGGCEERASQWVEVMFLKRTMWAVALSVPLALVGFAVSDSTKCPKLLRYIISPGNALAEHIPPAYGSLADVISRGVSVTLAANAAYYTVILWFLFTVFRVFLDA
jgi:hypothetical protein